MRQTQMSLLFFAGDYVYKVKKPVNLGYLDYSTLADRKRLCEQEVSLNRRLCPDAYLGVVPITACGGALRVEAAGNPVEYAVKMRRLPPERMLDGLLQQGLATRPMMQRIAARVASFHSAAATSPHIATYGASAVIKGNTDENFAQTRPFIGRTVTTTAHALLERYASGYLEAHSALLQKRIDDGRIRDCHGDLHAAHICMTGDVCIYDCIEFNDRFRYGDVASEVAFLAMDLDRFSRNDLSQAFVDSYVEISKDEGVLTLLPFYACYRAVVRGKVEGFKLNDPMIPQDEQRTATWLARTYFELAGRYATGSGLLVLMSGVTASGKSTVAQRLGGLLAGSVFSSDVIRKKLAGLKPEDHSYDRFERGIYSPDWTRRTYDELLRLATPIIAAGGCAILDASFLRQAERERAAAVAAATNARLAVVECTAPGGVLLQRLTTREASGGVSDGRPEILAGQIAAREPLQSLPGGTRITVDTSGTIELIMEEIWEQL